MSIVAQLQSECFNEQPADSHARANPIVFRRVFRLTCIELQGYQSDLESMTADQARERFAERVEGRYRKLYRVEESHSTEGGPYGFVITIAVILAALVSTAISWLIWKGLDALWDWFLNRHPKATRQEALAAFAMDAESFGGTDE